MASYELDINFNTDTTGIEEAMDILSDLRDVADEVEISVSNINGDSLQEMGNQASETESNIRSSAEAMDDLGNKTDEVSGKMQETADSSAGIGTALAGIGGAIGLDMMITKADNINTSWNQLSLTFANTGVSMDTLKSKSAELSSETGRSGTQVREYFNQMGIAGITNVDLLSTSFENMTGRAYQTGSSVEQMESSVQRMVMSGNAGAKMLMRLGISSSDLADALGVTEDQAESTFKSLSAEERLEALNTAMGDGTEANEMYKNSYAGLKEQAEISLGGLMSSIGQSILPVVIPAIQTATQLVQGFTNVWKALPSPLTAVFGVFGGGIVAITTVAGTLGALGKVGSSVVGGLKSMKSAFDTLRTAMSTARLMVDALRNAESISEGVRSALAIATGAETVSEEANAVAKAGAVAPTSALAVAENLLLSPIVLVTLAIVGLIAVLYYLYNNNEQVRESIDALISAVQGFISKVTEALQPIITFVQQAVSWFFSLLSQVGAILLSFVAQWMINWVTALTTGINIVTQIVTGIGALFNQMRTNIQTALMLARVILFTVVGSWRGVISTVRGVVSGITSAFNGIRSAISGAMSGVQRAISAPFTSAYNTVKPIIDNIKKAWDMLQSVGMSGYEGWSESSVGYEGWDDNALNGSLSSSVNNTQTSQVNNFNINGIIEEEASRYIINSVNDELRKQRLIRGV